jgi:F-type H+-transporting ATPase subunit b
LGAQRRAALESETRNMTRVIRDRAQDEVFAIARETLTDMANASLEERMCEMFVGRLKVMDKQAKLELSDVFKTAAEPALIRSAFALTPEQRAAIQSALAAEFAGPISVRFDVAPQLVAGIELTVNGRRLGWSISDYLDTLKEKVAELAQPATGNP